MEVVMRKPLEDLYYAPAAKGTSKDSSSRASEDFSNYQTFINAETDHITERSEDIVYNPAKEI